MPLNTNTEIYSVIEPIYNDLKSLTQLGKYLTSNDFTKFCVKSGIGSLWRKALKTAENNRTYFAFGFDHGSNDAIEALGALMNHYYRADEYKLSNFIYCFLFNYCEFNNCSIDTSAIIDSLKIISAPSKFIKSIEKLDIKKHSVPIALMPVTINSRKLNEYLKKIDILIKNKEYDQVLTYCYTCLEGLFKYYIKIKINDNDETNELNQLAKNVRDDIEQKLKEKNAPYPDAIIKLIPTITNAISNARNSFSSSHFDKDSYLWLAVFSRDCVNSIGRLILHFLN